MFISIKIKYLEKSISYSQMCKCNNLYINKGHLCNQKTHLDLKHLLTTTQYSRHYNTYSEEQYSEIVHYQIY